MADREVPVRPAESVWVVDKQLQPIRRYLKTMPRTTTWVAFGLVVGTLYMINEATGDRVTKTVQPIYKRQLQQEGLWTRWQLPREAGGKMPKKYI